VAVSYLPKRHRPRSGCIVLRLRAPEGIAVSGVVESGYGRDLVERLPQLTRAEYRALQTPGRVWAGDAPLGGEVKFLSGAGRAVFVMLSLVSVSD
jgi:hypothetical protein